MSNRAWLMIHLQFDMSSNSTSTELRRGIRKCLPSGLNSKGSTLRKSLVGRLLRRQKKNVTRVINAQPPTSPLTIASIGALLDVEVVWTACSPDAVDAGARVEEKLRESDDVACEAETIALDFGVEGNAAANAAVKFGMLAGVAKEGA